MIWSMGLLYIRHALMGFYVDGLSVWNVIGKLLHDSINPGLVSINKRVHPNTSRAQMGTYERHYRSI